MSVGRKVVMCVWIQSCHSRPGALLVALALSVSISLCSLRSASAGPASPEGVEVRQPDGTSFQLRIRGDEFCSWHETSDGYAVVKDPADGFWKFAQPATNRVAFVAIPEARVGSSEAARYALRKHAMPPADLLRTFIEERRRAILGEPKELPVSQAVTNANVSTNSKAK